MLFSKKAPSLHIMTISNNNFHLSLPKTITVPILKTSETLRTMPDCVKRQVQLLS